MTDPIIVTNPNTYATEGRKTLKLEVEFVLDQVAGAWHQPEDLMRWIAQHSYVKEVRYTPVAERGLNIPALTEVAEWLETAPDDGLKFDMSFFVFPPTDFDQEEAAQAEEPNWCGTSCCIGGFVAQRYYPAATWATLTRVWNFDLSDYSSDPERVLADPHLMLDYERVAANKLGLDEDQQRWLFMGHFVGKCLDEITREEAAKAVRALIANPEIHLEGRLA